MFHAVEDKLRVRHTIDLFASVGCRQLDRYVSKFPDGRSVAVDAFSLRSWSGEVSWVNCDWDDLDRVAQRLEAEVREWLREAAEAEVSAAALRVLWAMCLACDAACLPFGMVGELRRKLSPIALAVLLLFMGVGIMNIRVSAEFPSSRQRAAFRAGNDASRRLASFPRGVRRRVSRRRRATPPRPPRGRAASPPTDPCVLPVAARGSCEPQPLSCRGQGRSAQ